MANHDQKPNAKLDSILDAVDAAVVTIDQLGLILDANSATARLFGYEISQLIGKNVKVLMPAPYREEHDGYLHNHATTGVNRIIGQGRRLEGIRKNGSIFPIHLSVAKFEERGKIYYTGILHDLSELVRVESESQKLARIINECINEVYTFHHESLLFNTANKAALKNIGYSVEEICRLTPIDLVPNLNINAFKANLEKLKKGVNHHLAFKEALQRKDGTTYQVELQMYYLDELDPPEYATIALDVTERNKILDSLRQSQKMESIGNLTGGIAHDFNNILTVVLGNAELLKTTERTTEDNELIGEITDAALMGSRLTNRLLAFARRRVLKPEQVDVNQLIKGLEEMLVRLVDKPIDLLLSLRNDACLVNVDVSELENALVNLVVNARDAMPNGGTIAIETSLGTINSDSPYVNDLNPGDYIKLVISDNGRGIAPSIKDKIFEPFVTTKTETHGTGMGLSMVYGFVKQSGGHIICYSDVGQGSTFTIYLPHAALQIKTESEENTNNRGNTTLSQKKILIAEDDDKVRQLTIKRLELLGHQVIAASDGHEALDIFKNNQNFDLIFTDVVMTKGMNGYELAKIIQTIKPDIPILLTSGYAENVINETKLAESGLSLIRKPYEQHELVDALDKAMGST